MEKVLSEVDSQGLRVKVECDEPIDKPFLQAILKAGKLLGKFDFDSIRIEPIE